MSKTGICRLCGEPKELTYEHVPPKKAFNDEAMTAQDFNHLLDKNSKFYGKLIKLPRGFGVHSLCGSCNNKTGSWYARHYVDFALQAHRHLMQGPHEPHQYHITPLAVFKQALVMFASLESTKFLRDIDGFKNYLLYPEKRNAPDRFRMFLYYAVSPLCRKNGSAVAIDITNANRSVIYEMTHYPIGIAMTVDGTKPVRWFTEITHFKSFAPDEVAELQLAPYFLHVNSMAPLAFDSAHDTRGNCVYSHDLDKR